MGEKASVTVKGTDCFGRQVNSACMKRGEQCVREAKEKIDQRKEAVRKDIEASAKDAANTISARARGRKYFFMGKRG